MIWTMDSIYGYETLEKLISLLNVDAFIDLEEKKESGESRHHVHKILLHEPNYLFSYTHLAYQSYLIDPASVSVLGKTEFRSIPDRSDANQSAGDGTFHSKC